MEVIGSEQEQCQIKIFVLFYSLMNLAYSSYTTYDIRKLIIIYNFNEIGCLITINRSSLI
jgi:hypothetical protein